MFTVNKDPQTPQSLWAGQSVSRIARILAAVLLLLGPDVLFMTGTNGWLCLGMVVQLAITWVCAWMNGAHHTEMRAAFGRELAGRVKLSWPNRPWGGHIVVEYPPSDLTNTQRNR